MSFSLGFIGFGEAAYNMGKGLKGEGLEDIKAYDVVMDKEGPMRDTVLKRCEDAKIKPVFSAKELVENSDFVVIAVPARFTASTADGLRKFARAGQLFADVTTALPPVKEAQAKAYAEIGADYIDSAMLGSLMALGHKVPILASGKGCKKWHDTMNPYNMKISLVNLDDPDNTKAGEASKIKLVRSVFMKGIEGLIVETLLFARKCGVEDYILSSISNSMNRDKFEDIALRMAGADLIHSERRSFEVGESMELMKEVGVEPLMAQGTKDRLARTAALGLNEELHGIVPKEFSRIYSLWEEKKYS